MRTLLFLMVPILWGILWYTIRQLMLTRMHRRMSPSEPRGPVIEVKERRSRRGRPGPPPCGRTGVHFLLRIVGSDSSCRRCHALEDADARSEAAAAVAAAEEAIKGNERQPPAAPPRP